MWAAVISLISVAISIALMLKPVKGQKKAPQAFDAPTAQEGLTIPVLFGTRNFKSSNVVWYGDIKTVAVKSSSGKK